jgi:hypothetical protein
MIASTVRGILGNDHPSFELHVVDQSSDDSTATALAPFMSDERFFYMRSASQGLARAERRNRRKRGRAHRDD